MSKAIHRALELLFGIPLLLFGGNLIYFDIAAYFWVQEDPAHRRSLFFGTPLGIIPFLVGCWLVSAAVVRMLRPKRHP
jgi:hypothetical protein